MNNTESKKRAIRNFENTEMITKNICKCLPPTAKKLKTHQQKQSYKVKRVYNDLENDVNSNRPTSFKENKIGSAESSDSIIYIGSFRDDWPVIDLTDSLTSLQSEKKELHSELSSSSMKTLRIPSKHYQTIYIKEPLSSKNRNVITTTSTSHINSSQQSYQDDLKISSKSASNMLLLYDHGHTDKLNLVGGIPPDYTPLTQEDYFNLDKNTQLNSEDEAIINMVLNLEEDYDTFNSLEPHKLMNSDISIEGLKSVYNITSRDNFH